jgi:hypothetical protein
MEGGNVTGHRSGRGRRSPHAAAVVDARTTAARTGSMDGEERGDPKPEEIGERERRRDRGR